MFSPLYTLVVLTNCTLRLVPCRIFNGACAQWCNAANNGLRDPLFPLELSMTCSIHVITSILMLSFSVMFQYKVPSPVYYRQWYLAILITVSISLSASVTLRGALRRCIGHVKGYRDPPKLNFQAFSREIEGQLLYYNINVQYISNLSYNYTPLTQISTFNLKVSSEKTL